MHVIYSMYDSFLKPNFFSFKYDYFSTMIYNVLSNASMMF